MIHKPKERPTLQELQKLVGGYIEIFHSPDGKQQIIVNEEGKMQRLPVNYEATAIWLGTSVEKALAYHDVLVGDAVILEGKTMVD